SAAPWRRASTSAVSSSPRATGRPDGRRPDDDGSDAARFHRNVIAVIEDRPRLRRRLGNGRSEERKVTVALQSGSHPALVLNADYRPLSYYPLSLWSWQDAIKAVFLDRVNIVSRYDVLVRSP